MNKVYVKFPKAGLGNLLLIWARAKVFAHINQLQIVTAPWWGFRRGAWIRNEKKKRLYNGYFKESRGIENLQIKIFGLLATIVQDPPVKPLLQYNLKNENTLFVFHKISTSNDLYADIREYRDFVIEEIYQLLRPLMLQRFRSYTLPVIAVHIRRGDFKIANPITPISFFIDCINQIRNAAGDLWPETIFTDAEEYEIEELLQLPQVAVAESKPDILDILLMSKSKVIVLSQSSTFSYWGAFLSDAIILKPANDWQKNLRSENINKQYPEIRWEENDTACVEQLNLSIKNMLA